jgi:hypothetical protein
MLQITVILLSMAKMVGCFAKQINLLIFTSIYETSKMIKVLVFYVTCIIMIYYYSLIILNLEILPKSKDKLYDESLNKGLE